MEDLLIIKDLYEPVDKEQKGALDMVNGLVTYYV